MPNDDRVGSLLRAEADATELAAQLERLGKALKSYTAVTDSLSGSSHALQGLTVAQHEAVEKHKELIAQVAKVVPGDFFTQLALMRDSLETNANKADASFDQTRQAATRAFDAVADLRNNLEAHVRKTVDAVSDLRTAVDSSMAGLVDRVDRLRRDSEQMSDQMGERLSRMQFRMTLASALLFLGYSVVFMLLLTR